MSRRQRPSGCPRRWARHAARRNSSPNARRPSARRARPHTMQCLRPARRPVLTRPCGPPSTHARRRCTRRRRCPTGRLPSSRARLEKGEQSGAKRSGDALAWRRAVAHRVTSPVGSYPTAADAMTTKEDAVEVARFDQVAIGHNIRPGVTNAVVDAAPRSYLAGARPAPCFGTGFGISPATPTMKSSASPLSPKVADSMPTFTALPCLRACAGATSADAS